MAIGLYTQSFGATYANEGVTIREAGTSFPATLLASATGGVISYTGNMNLDGSGNLSVYLDTARTWVVTLDDHVVQSSGGTGGLTDTQLRATPVPVSGTVTATTGGLTDTQLRASSVPVAPAAASVKVTANMTRPANVTAYTAGDVVGGVITFSNFGASNGQLIMLTSAFLRYDVAAVPSGMANMRLYLYDATPPSALADNAVWDLSSGDRSNFLGYIDLGTPVDLGSTLFAQADGLNKHVALGASTTNLFGYLVTTGGYTPAANSETFAVVLRGLAGV